MPRLTQSLSLLLLASQSAIATYSCLNEAGKPVDWFVALKENNSGNYHVLDSESSKGEFAHSKHSLENESGGSIIETIKQIYHDLPSKHGYVMYNDQGDDGHQSGARAHAKGVAAFDHNQGFWMIHSMPKFPNHRSEGYSALPDYKFGQSFICVTFGIEQFGAIAEQLDLMSVQIYDSGLQGLGKEVPAFEKLLAEHRHPHDSDATSLEYDLVSLGGQAFRHFGKSRDFEGNLYEDEVATGLADHLYVETWMNGNHDNQMPSFFGTPFNVVHVREVAMGNGATWRESQDHSKWVVSKSNGYACVGDVNRQYSQQNRGGGTLCVKNNHLWKAFHSIIHDSDEAKAATVLSRDTQHSSSSPLLPTPVIAAAVCAMCVVGAVGAMVHYRRGRLAASSERGDRYVAFTTPTTTATATTVVMSESGPQETSKWSEGNCV